MGRLKNIYFRKLNASSLTEVIVATTILLVVFGLALVTLSNIMRSVVTKDTQQMNAKIEKLIYQYKNNQINIPSAYREGDFMIAIQKSTQRESDFIEFSITDAIHKKRIVQKLLFYETD